MSEQHPDVSIVIAAYNAAGTIGAAIASALAQTDVSLEVIVADDCSADETRDLVSAMADPRIRLVALANNRGPGGARNAAIEVAKGRWIAVLDADDTMHPDRLARMIAKAQATGAQVVVDNLEVVRRDGSSQTMFAREHLEKTREITLPAFIDSNVLFRSEHNYGYMKPLFQRAFLADNNLAFDENLRIGEDYLLLASALAAGGRCVVDPDVGYRYHITEGSISRVLRLDHVETMIDADAGFLRHYRLPPEALAAQRRRDRSLTQARSFVLLVDQLKRRSLVGAIGTALRNPVALRHLRMPIAARLRRLTHSPSTSRSTDLSSKRPDPA